jgi:NADH-quinone oxidoreductase subunit F
VEGSVELKTTGCPGFCEQGPLVMIHPQGILYTHVKPKDAAEIVSKTIQKNEIVERLLFQDPHSGEKIVYESEVPFYKEQTRVLLKNSGVIDPRKIEDYIAVGGYQALKRRSSNEAEEVIRSQKIRVARAWRRRLYDREEVGAVPERGRIRKVHHL